LFVYIYVIKELLTACIFELHLAYATRKFIFQANNRKSLVANYSYKISCTLVHDKEVLNISLIVFKGGYFHDSVDLMTNGWS